MTDKININVGLDKVEASMGGKDIQVNKIDDVFVIVVKNIPGVSLPNTGGMGTTAFTAGGIALIALALFLLMKKRMAMND